MTYRIPAGASRQPTRPKIGREAEFRNGAKPMIRKYLTSATLGGLAAAATLFAAENPMVGGAPMDADKNIVQNAMNSKDHTTLVAAVKAAGLVDTLESKGPFTVFAPTNEAFDKLPSGTVDTLVKPENKKKLSGILTYHVLAGKMTAEALMDKIKAGGGKAMLKTVNGESLTAKMDGDTVELTDKKGGTSKVTTADVMQSNGVIHVVDTVLMP
jgi:uncharacterized surface protein with fasciclin (FAS1) repeats